MNGNLDVSGTLGVTGVLTATSLDISGDIDVDGTTNLDVVDIDGAVDFGSTTAHAGNATFADNAKAIFGAGSDLQIYSDGTTGQVTGNVNVTGTVTADGLTVDGGTYHKVVSTFPSTYVTNLQIGQQGNINNDASIDELLFNHTGTNAASNTLFKINSKNVLNIESGGDISFYEDTGTTPKFFWDASAESLGIGTSSVVSALDVLNGGNTYTSGLVLRNGSSTSEATSLYHDNTGSTTTVLANRYGSDSAAIKLVLQDAGVSPVTALTALGNGNVGIGTSSPAYKLDIRATSTPTIRVLETTNGPDGRFLASASDVQIGTYGGSPLSFYTNSTEKMRIDTSGNVGIGTSSPATALSVVGDITTTGGVYLGGTGAANKLDDYEEGTWTPTLEGTTSAGTTTYTGQSGDYTKIGNTVTIGFYISFTAATGTGEMKLGGLPFTQNAVNTNNVKLGGVMTDGLNWDVDGSLILMGTINTTYMRLGISRDDTAIHIQGVTNETATIWGSLTYITNS